MAFQKQVEQKKWTCVKNTSITYASDFPFASSAQADIFFARKNHPKLTFPLLALKVYKNNQKPSRLIQNLIGLHFTNIISFYQVQQQNFPFCLMELCSKNLRQYRPHSEVDRRSQQILAIARQMINGMVELKQLRIIHGDIKPQNILMSASEIIKICDLDFAVTEKEVSEKCLRVGTFEYMAPEMLLKGKCSYRSDIWSFGIVIYELYFGKHPFPKLQLLGAQGEQNFREGTSCISRQIQQVRAKIAMIREESQYQNTIEIMNVLLCSLNFNAQQRKGLEELAAIANRNQRVRKMSDFVNDDIEQQGQSALYHNKTLLKILQYLLSDIKNLPKGDVLLKKARELEANLQRLINCIQRQTQTSKFDFEALIQKFSIQSRKISSIIQNNLKRLGGGVQEMANYEERLMFRQHIELANSFLSKQNQRQKTIVQGFHTVTSLSQTK